jgi:mono/diheme cytochrome c family protein
MRIFPTIGALLLSATFVFGQEPVPANSTVTAVTGESWLRHLHRSFDDTSMGKTWRLGPADLATEPAIAPVRLSTRSDSPTKGSEAQLTRLRGSDLYRVNCRGCHGEAGLGVPPEIGSLIDPVRATSAVLVDQRMKKIGMAMSRREAADIARQSEGALLQRLHEGGTDMPSFPYLSEAEIRSLVAYLQLLAGVPGTEKKQVEIRVSRARVGELIVKSTCHVCHGATGTNPSPAELFEGAIPALSVLSERVNRAQLARKVTSGAPVVMGTASSLYRGRMPVFDYLSEDEAAAVYEYLLEYPPTQVVGRPEPSLFGLTDPPADPRQPRVIASEVSPPQVPVSRPPSESLGLPISVGAFVILLLVLGFWFTVHECKRLSVESRARRSSHRPAAKPAPWINLQPAVDLQPEPIGLWPVPIENNAADWTDGRQIS